MKMQTLVALAAAGILVASFSYAGNPTRLADSTTGQATSVPAPNPEPINSPNNNGQQTNGNNINGASPDTDNGSPDTSSSDNDGASPDTATQDDDY